MWTIIFAKQYVIFKVNSISVLALSIPAKTAISILPLKLGLCLIIFYNIVCNYLSSIVQIIHRLKEMYKYTQTPFRPLYSPLQ
jgi:hypothetical protein